MVALLVALVAMQTKSYTNPVYPHNFPDPFIVQDGDTFYAYATQNGPKGFQVLESKNLVDWKPLPPVGKPSWSSANLWAPELYKYNGRWYFFFTAKNPKTNKRDLAVSVGDSPLGPFKDLATLVTGVSENSGTDDNGAIDGNVYFDGDQPYLLYIKEAPSRAIKIVALASDMTKTVGEARVLLHPTLPDDQGILDAPTLIKHDGKYWLFFSCGWFQSYKKDARYRICVCVADSPLGPYKRLPQPVIESKPGETYSPGHQDVFQLPSGEWWIAYHGWNAEGDPLYGSNPLGRTLRIDRLTWTKDGPKSNGPTTTPQPVPKISK